MWRIRKRKIKRASSVTKHYAVHKEDTRVLIHNRLVHWNQYYGLHYNRVAIRNQRRCWGSCTSLKNLNFSYKLLFLPPHLQDYIVVHELCHLKELNHGKNFWLLVAEQIPEYREHIKELKLIEQGGLSAVRLEKLKESYTADVRISTTNQVY
jgi:predicted metal-dependent hydrolase